MAIFFNYVLQCTLFTAYRKKRLLHCELVMHKMEHRTELLVMLHLQGIGFSSVFSLGKRA